jgi:DNA mismatch endonuclease (patch repair protein)
MTTAQRSFTMSRIRSKGNATTELRFLQILRRAGVAGWRRNAPLPGRPDLVFRRERVAVFLDGCFWHACPRCSKPPKSNLDYWHQKLTGNATRDRAVTRELRQRGWFVVRIWEHTIRTDPHRAVGRLRAAILKNRRDEL